MVLVCTPGVTTAVPDAAIEEVLGAGSRDPSMPLDAVAQNLLRALPEHLRSRDRAVALARLSDHPRSKDGQLQ
jgi:hypothetical protein